MSDCTLCEGKLVERGPWSQQWPDAWRACKACLSTPATDEIREVAREGLGPQGAEFDHLSEWPLRENWWGPLMQEPVLPLYLDAGYDLGCRVLARQHELPTFGGVTFTQHSKGQWELRGTVKPGGMYPGGNPEMHDYSRRFTADLSDGERRMQHHRGMERLWVAVPSLATIPADAPPNLRAARALKLCLEAT